LTGTGGVPSTGVAGVLIDATVIDPLAAGTITVWAAGAKRPSAPSVQFGSGQQRTNLVRTNVNAKGRIEVYTTAAVYLQLDVQGWNDAFTFSAYDPTSGSQYIPVSPRRALDTRSGLGGPTGKVGAGTTLNLTVGGPEGGTPDSSVRAVAVDVTAVSPAAAGTLAVLPTGKAVGSTKSLSYDAGGRATGLVVSRVSGSDSISITVAGGATHVVADIMGFYSVPGTNIVTGQSTSVPPVKVLDTAATNSTLQPSTTRTVPVHGVGQIPSFGVSAVALLVRTKDASGSGYLTFWDGLAPNPGTFTASFAAGAPSTQLVYASVDDSSGTTSIRTSGASVNVRIDAVAWFAFVIPPPPTVSGPPPDGAAVASPTERAPLSPKRSMRRASKFVEKDRLPDAQPEPLLAQRSDGTLTAGAPPGDYPASPLPRWNYGYLPSSSYDPYIGRLYFVDASDGQWHACSGTVVAKNLVLTAGHCVYDWEANNGNGAWNSNWVFAPKLQGSNEPFGEWQGNNATSWYAQYYFAPLDWAFVVIPPVNGEYLGTSTGWPAIKSNPGGSVMYSVGYPYDGVFGSNCPWQPLSCYAYYNYSQVGEYVPFANGWYDVAMGAYINGGASGGPIFEYIDGQWKIASVNSIASAPTDNTNALYQNISGPWFNSWIITTYNQNAVT
jgi:hypothetical protein